MIVINERGNRVNLAVLENDEVGNLIVTLKNIQKSNLGSYESVKV